jgi:hypothetical protein
MTPPIGVLWKDLVLADEPRQPRVAAPWVRSGWFNVRC